MNDHMVRAVNADGTLRAIAARTTLIAEETRRRQQTDLTASVAVGRVITGTALMGALLKGDQRLAVTFEGNGPLRKIIAETDAEGHVRATVSNPIADLPPKDDRFDVAGAIGAAGFLQVSKDLGLKEPYSGMVQLVSSEVGEDIAYYLTTSEQIPSSVSLGVILGMDGSIVAAGGLIVQALPGAPDDVIDTLELSLKSLPPIATLIREGITPAAILERVFEGIGCTVTEGIDLDYRCTCSHKQMIQLLTGVAKEELPALIDEGDGASITCEFCKEVYHFTHDNLTLLRDNRSRTEDD